MAMIKQHFSEYAAFTETFFLTCMLHDIGTTPKNTQATQLSFEFYGGFLAQELLHGKLGAPKSQAESVCETIIRHQDLGETGTISSLCALIHLVTIFDNMGLNSSLIDKKTIESVTQAYPRKKWSSCFGATVDNEITVKPWCHTTVIEGFADGVRGNKLMEPYD